MANLFYSYLLNVEHFILRLHLEKEVGVCYNVSVMENLNLNKRKFKLYNDNAEYAGEAMRNFLDLYRGSLGNNINNCISQIEHTHKNDMYEMLIFFKDGLFDEYGAFAVPSVDLNKNLSDDEIKKIAYSTPCFDKMAKLNGWIVDTSGNIYPAKNHPNFINFLTLFGVDCSSFIRVTNAPIGLAPLNFSSASHYIDVERSEVLTKEQVLALYNLKRIYELRFENCALRLQDYILDSMLGGYLHENGDLYNMDNLKTIQKYCPENFSANETYKNFLYYSKHKESYEEDFGAELRI